MSKLNLDRDVIESCRLSAQKIVRQLDEILLRHSSISIERATLRFLGVNDTLSGFPLVNLIVDSLPPNFLAKGIAYWIGRAMVVHRSSLMGVALKVAQKKIDLSALPEVPFGAIREAFANPMRSVLRRFDQKMERRHQALSRREGSNAIFKIFPV